MTHWKTKKTEILLDTPWVKVRRDSVRLPNGARIDDFYAVTIRDASAVVALERAVDMVMANEICCNSSAHGILRAARMAEFARTSKKSCKIDCDLL